MKKLMIAAAVAAMIGGAEAYWAYDFSATLKTTTAKAGKGYTDTYKMQLGQNVEGEWWYNSDVFEDGKYEGVQVVTYSKGVGKLNVKGLSEFQKVTLGIALAEYGRVWENGVLIAGEGVPDIYKGKETWCGNFTAKIVTPGQCYRVAGNKKISTKYYLYDCCDADDAEPEQIAGFTCDFGALTDNDMVLPDLTTDLLFLFGGETYQACKKVEFVGQIGNGVADPSVFDDDILPTFALAGQGTIGTLKDADGETATGVSSISGNIVGIWLDPECEVCCGDNAVAIVFACNGDDNVNDETSDNVYEYEVDEVESIEDIGTDNNVVYYYGDTFYKSSGVKNLWGTAAYGTFTLKFNKKNSSFIW